MSLPFQDGIPGWRCVDAGLAAAGQPARDDWARLRAAGLRSVINLRPPSEQAGEAEDKDVRAAGLSYADLPVRGVVDLDREHASQLHALLSSLPAPVLVHCASGNRVGALLALRAAWCLGAEGEEALRTGRAAGLASLEPRVRELLDV